MTPKHLIIDGYNVLGAMGLPPEKVVGKGEVYRDQFVTRLGIYSQAIHCPVTSSWNCATMTVSRRRWHFWRRPAWRNSPDLLCQDRHCRDDTSPDHQEEMGELAFKVAMEAVKVVAADQEACPVRGEYDRPYQRDGGAKCWIRAKQPCEPRQRSGGARVSRRTTTRKGIESTRSSGFRRTRSFHSSGIQQFRRGKSVNCRSHRNLIQGSPETPLHRSRFHRMCPSPGWRGVAQLVEHRSPKPRVVGSSPSAPAMARRNAAPFRREMSPFRSDAK